MRRLTSIIAVLMAGSLLLGAAWVFAQEHPKHPTKANIPQKKAQITKEALANAIADYVKKQAKLEGGYFMFYDSGESKPLRHTA